MEFGTGKLGFLLAGRVGLIFGLDCSTLGGGLTGLETGFASVFADDCRDLGGGVGAVLREFNGMDSTFGFDSILGCRVEATSGDCG